MTIENEQEIEAVDNLELWKSVETTSTKFTKESVTKGGFTSINATYQIKKATDIWGPYGKGWGLRDMEKDFSLLESTGLIIYQARFFCPEATFVINNAFTVKDLKTGRVDSDFMKKVETDTITKALSRLGFNADVFMGQFDDIDYLQERHAEEEIEAAEDKEKMLADKYNEIKNYVEQSCRGMLMVPSKVSLDKVYQKTLSNTRKKLNAYQFNPNRLDSVITKAYEQRKSELELIG